MLEFILKSLIIIVNLPESSQISTFPMDSNLQWMYALVSSHARHRWGFVRAHSQDHPPLI